MPKKILCIQQPGFCNGKLCLQRRQLGNKLTLPVFLNCDYSSFDIGSGTGGRCIGEMVELGSFADFLFDQ